MNRGIDIERELKAISKEDRKLGASSDEPITTIPMDEREWHLPVGELQCGSRGDMMDCASRSPVNIMEMYFNRFLFESLLTREEYQFLESNGYINEEAVSGMVEFSDAFIAIKSGTTERGNSLKEPLQAMRDWGMIPKSMLPFVETMSFDEYHDPSRITTEMEELGQKFNEMFTVFYERVLLIDFDKVLESEVLDTAGYAWVKPDENGVYHGTENVPNHAFMTFSLLEDGTREIFDNYKDSYDDDYIKKVSNDYGYLGYGYTVNVARNIYGAENEQQALIEMLINWLQKLFNMLRF